MADRVSASITIGGTITAATWADLAACIAGEGLSIEWDGPEFTPDQRGADAPLRLYAHEVAWGRFEDLEAMCVEAHIPFARWSDAYGGQWGAERIVHRGDGMLDSYVADGDDVVLIDRQTVERLGSFAAIRAHFDEADFDMPPLVVTD